MLDFNFIDLENGFVFDDFLLNLVYEYIFFVKDCGNKEKCILDFSLYVVIIEKDLLIVWFQNDKFNVSFIIKNIKDSVYNIRIIVYYFLNLVFLGIEVI